MLLQFLLSQCSARVEGRRRPDYRNGGSASGGYRGRAAAWGDGRIGMLLVAYAFE